MNKFIIVIFSCLFLLLGCNTEKEEKREGLSEEEKTQLEQEEAQLRAKAKAAEKAGTATLTLICDRTEQVKKAILEQAQKTDCSQVTVENLQAIVRLDLNSQGIKELKANDFEGLNALQVLDLSNNDLKSLSPNQFEGLNALVGLDLSYNNLSDEQQKRLLKEGLPHRESLSIYF